MDHLQDEFETFCVHGDDNKNYDKACGYASAVAPPLSVSTTFINTDNPNPTFVYSRDTDPTRSRCEALLGGLEGANDYAITYRSGLAAVMAALFYYAPINNIFVCPGYHGTHQAIDLLKKKGMIKNVFSLEETDKLSKGDCVWIESPNNPKCDVFDIEELSQLCQKTQSHLIIDATFAPPPTMFPLRLGCDMVMHSTTKYLSGHSDGLGGCLIVKHKAVHNALAKERLVMGNVPGNLETWLLLRSLRTLKIRVREQCESAMAVATWLETEGKKNHGVSLVHYPGLPSSPNYAIAKKQMPGGYGGVLSFQLSEAWGSAENIPKFTQFFKDATSLGGVESLIEWRRKYDDKISPELLRLSIGLESHTDLIKDLIQAIDKVKKE